MANEAPGDIFAGGGLPFVNAETKAALATLKVPFGITGASPKSVNQFGDDETGFEITVSTKAAKAAGNADLAGEWKITLSHNEVRERQAKAVLDRLASGASSIGPVYLCQVQTKSGKTAWSIATEPMDGPAVASAAPAADADDDDGIPY